MAPVIVVVFVSKPRQYTWKRSEVSKKIEHGNVLVHRCWCPCLPSITSTFYDACTRCRTLRQIYVRGPSTSSLCCLLTFYCHYPPPSPSPLPSPFVPSATWCLLPPPLLVLHVAFCCLLIVAIIKSISIIKIVATTIIIITIATATTTVIKTIQ